MAQEELVQLKEQVYKDRKPYPETWARAQGKGRVFYTSMGDDAARGETTKALERATPFFRRHLGGRLRLRRVPELEFRFDESIVNQDRIEQILRDLHHEEEQRAAVSEGDGSNAAPTGSEHPASTDDDKKR